MYGMRFLLIGLGFECGFGIWLFYELWLYNGVGILDDCFSLSDVDD